MVPTMVCTRTPQEEPTVIPLSTIIQGGNAKASSRRQHVSVVGHAVATANDVRETAHSWSAVKGTLALTGSRIFACSFTKRDAWTFAGASIDQGFIWWLFFLVHQRGTWAERMGTYGPAHFWGAVKPWRPSALGQGARNLTVAYLWRLAELGSSDKSNVSPGSSKCRGLLEDIKERLQRERSWFEPTPATLQAANLGWLNTSRCLHCILPSPNIAA